MLGAGFKHRDLVGKAIVKAQTRMSTNVTVRQSYETGMDGTRKWCVDTSGSTEHLFDTFDEAMTFVRNL